MNSGHVWHKVPISSFIKSAEDDATDYGLVGASYVMNSKSHKYFFVIDDRDIEIIRKYRDAEEVDADMVTEACQPFGSANDLVDNDKRSDENHSSGIGLGDKISALLGAIGLDYPCSRCKSRRALLNKLFSIKT